MKSLPLNFGHRPRVYHVSDIFAENYRLLHITLNNPPNHGLIIETNRAMKQYEESIGMKKMVK
jgi:hypothetical protein